MPVTKVTNNIKTNEWYDYFKQLFNISDDSNANYNLSRPSNVNSDETDNDFDQLLQGPITLIEIDQALNNLKVGKASGSDGIGSEFYKVNSNILRECLYSLFNKIYELSYYPTEWCKSLIHPLHKKGNHGHINFTDKSSFVIVTYLKL